MTTINITPFDTASFATCLFVLVAVNPAIGQEYKYDWKDYVILKDDVSEVRRNREDTYCLITLESGLSHQIPFEPLEVTVTIGATVPATNEEMRDLLVGIVTGTTLP